jgi:hypothetical protein
MSPSKASSTGGRIPAGNLGFPTLASNGLGRNVGDGVCALGESGDSTKGAPLEASVFSIKFLCILIYLSLAAAS